MKEKDAQRLFGKANTVKGVFELKIMKGTSIAFSRLAGHQERRLLNASRSEGDYHKISDMSVDQKPWDCQLICDYPAYVVIVHYIPRKMKRCYYITIEEWRDMRGSCGRKSATPEMLEDASVHVLDL